MTIDPKFLLDGVASEFLRVDRASMQHLLGVADRQMITRLVMLESWLRMYFGGVTIDHRTADLESRVKISPASGF